MNVTIVGTGNMGRGIGLRLVSGGHAVTVLGTELANAQELAAELGGSVTVQEGLGTGYGSAVKIVG